jgi:putative transposase
VCRSTAKAETALAELVATYRETAPKLAAWLEESVPEGLAVFALPEHHRRRLRRSNPMERAVQQELKRRTIKVRVFPGDNALERLVSAILVAIDEKNGPRTPRPTSSGNARMRDPRSAEFPDNRLLNHRGRP